MTNQKTRSDKDPTKPSQPAPELQQATEHMAHILDEIGKVIVGQEHMNRSLLLGLMTGGHILLEGLPGLAKTLSVRTLAQVLDADFKRIQFTPDLLPSDLIGTMIYNEQTKNFLPKKGPIFTNILLADEINRAPAKVQSALLEAMGEKQVTIGETTYQLEEPFLVLATQNPIEQEGTYNLPEAQLDRFMFKVKVNYPTRAEERIILDRMTTSHIPTTQQVFSTKLILSIRAKLDDIYMDERVKEYILRLVMATRTREQLGPSEALAEGLLELRRSVLIGASPRATIFLTRAAKAHAMLEGRTFVTPDDVKSIAPEILRHRVILSFEAEAKNITTDELIGILLETVVVP